MTRTAGAQIGCQRPSRFWGLGCPKIYHEVEDTLVFRFFEKRKLTAKARRWHSRAGKLYARGW
ncbi:hypothetical protein [Thiolapillus sp.]|uniref:hypothetical protein n=1 Tax=Thiolapillus sp. TaxID=2017437 RepID=UPI0025EBABED|nr:hypothetical protein [Thiolapillus sp.]